MMENIIKKSNENTRNIGFMSNCPEKQHQHIPQKFTAQWPQQLYLKYQ